jgi:hypothetical protein
MFSDIGPSPIMFQWHLVQLLAVRILTANSAHSSVSSLYFLHTVVGNSTKNKFKSFCQWHRELLKPRILFFSVGNERSPTLAIER